MFQSSPRARASPTGRSSVPRTVLGLSAASIFYHFCTTEQAFPRSHTFKLVVALTARHPPELPRLVTKMNKNWNDKADKDLFFTILNVKNIGVIGGTEWTTIGNHMRSLGYGFTNEGCR